MGRSWGFLGGVWGGLGAAGRAKSVVFPMVFQYFVNITFFIQMIILATLEAFLGHLEAILGRTWAGLGRSWAILVALGSLLGRLGAVLGRSWAVLGRPWAVSGRSWVAFGSLLGGLGAVLGGLGRSWVVLGPSLGGLGPSWGLLCRTRSLQLAMGLFCRLRSLQSVMGSLCRTHSALSVFSCSGFGPDLTRFWPDFGADFDKLLRNTVVQYSWDGEIQLYITFSILTQVKTSQNRGKPRIKHPMSLNIPYIKQLAVGVSSG